MAAGSDIHVRPNGTLNISYSLVTGLSSNYVGVVDGGNGDGIFTKFAEAKSITIKTAPNVKGTREPLSAVLAGWGITQ